jgi:succinate dehydrogenase / fumarate reductase, cytochrome b subunit
MSGSTRPVAKPRPVYLNLVAIRLPFPGFVSFLHRFSGAVMFVIGIPALLWAVEASLASPEQFAEFRTALSHPLAKLVVLGLLWAYLHHLMAGIRHLALDLHIGTDLKAARQSSTVVFVLALALTAIIGIRLW